MDVQSRREISASQTRQVLLDSARELFTTVGFDAASVDQIAGAAGVTKGAFYHHFSDKRSVFELLFRDRIARLADLIDEAADRIPRVADGPGWPVSLELVTAYLAMIVDDRDYRELLKQAPTVLSNRLYRRIDDELLLPPLQRMLGALSDRGELADVPIPMAASMLLSCLCEAALMIADAPDRAQTEREALKTITQLAAGLVRIG